VLGDVTAQPVPGVVEFQLNGEELKLTALGGDAKNGLFFVFNDLTPKNDTYPGGRFLDTGPIVNGHVELDFNCAYNPPCAVTPYATCSLAPKENRLAIAIPAGEKFDKTAHAHTKPHRSLLNRCSLATINAWERRSGSAPGDGEFSNTSGSP
jgi:uncharacterized protein (DUF1684 family)